MYLTVPCENKKMMDGGVWIRLYYDVYVAFSVLGSGRTRATIVCWSVVETQWQRRRTSSMTSVCMSSMTSRVDSAPPEPTDTVRHQTVGFVISSYHHHHHLRSSSSSQLVIRRTRLSTVGDRAFPVAGSRLWNTLPPDVASGPMLTVFLEPPQNLSLFLIISFLTFCRLSSVHCV